MSSERKIRDRISQNDVTVARSYLEVDVMEWFSANQIPFAYEPFTIPSVFGPNKDAWDAMVSAIRALGDGDQETYDNMRQGGPFATISAFEALNMWNEIYDKHRLAEERITVPVQESLKQFNKRLILPDFALYLDFDGKNALDGFDYSLYDYIIEVSGLWGVGLPGEGTEEDWWNWYRVSAVAFKEFVYKLLGLWDQVYWVIPNEPFIEGVTDGIPNTLRDDDHYIIINTTSSDVGLGPLSDRIGITADEIPSGLSPNIGLFEYDRPQQGVAGLNPVEWSYDRIVIDNVSNNKDVVIVAENTIVYHGEMGDVYIADDSIRVRRSQWQNMNMILIREYVLDSVAQLEEDGIIEGLKRFNG